MAAAVKTESAPHEAGEAAAPASGSRKGLMIGLIVLLVVVVQIVATWWFLARSAPAGDSHQASESDGGHEEASHDGGHGHGPDAGTDESDSAEVTIGDFKFSNTTAAPGTIIHVDFKLTAVAAHKQSGNLESQLKSHQARVRQAINKIIRSSSLDELNDPNMSTIKRQIREEINRLLRKSYVVEVVITDIFVIEQ